MNREVKVSVILPVYQVEMYLERAVDSVLAQTLPEIEIILVDDGSEDASPQICDRYAEEYPDRVKVIHKENQGLGLARNAGLDIACGDYVAFLDSDDTVEPEMYEELYAKAMEGSYDIVMCDVQIRYVEENRSSVVSTYSKKDIDLPDYIANGQNITYSVNKLFRRSIWEKHRYEKMLFEDIALIPTLVTLYPHIGYVPKPFYTYYRRPNTLSTSQTGAMVDIIQAFRLFLDTSDRNYREEVVYCTAKQMIWNMTQSRVLFQADFIDLLKEYEADFRLNPYIAKDKHTRKILDFLKKDVIPETFICVHFGRAVPESYRDELRVSFPNARLIEADESDFASEEFPDAVRTAMAEGNTSFAEEYAALKILAGEGGIVLPPDSRAQLPLKSLRLSRIFFGFEDEEELTTGCFGALPGHYVIQALLDTYETENIFNKAMLPLKDRLRDFLLLHFGLKVNGRKQLLAHEIQICLPSVLAYDMKDGENCCKHAAYPVPEGYELVSGKVLRMWSNRLLENWNLYKQALNGKKPASVPPPPARAGITPEQLGRELDERTREVMAAYENSTSWKITKPLRAFRDFFRKGRMRS